MSTGQTLLEMSVISLFMLWCVLILSARVAAQLVPSFQDLPRPFSRVLPRDYDGGWRAKPQIAAWLPLSIGLQLALLLFLQGVMAFIALDPPGFLMPYRSDDLGWRIPALVESALALYWLVKLALVVRSIRARPQATGHRGRGVRRD